MELKVSVLSKDRMVILWHLFGHFQPSSFHGSSCIFLVLFNHTGPCTIQSFLPTKSSSLPDTGNPGEMLQWQLRSLYKSNAHVLGHCFICCIKHLYAVVKLLCTKSRDCAPYTCLEGCVWAALGTLRSSRGIYGSVYRLQLARSCTHYFGVFCCL